MTISQNKYISPLCLIGCNRFNYFKQVLDALEPQINDRYIYLFLDRDINDNLCNNHIDYFLKKNFKNSQIIENNSHLGCGRNIINVRRQIFDILGYKQAFIFEDDMIPSSNYLDKCETLFNDYSGYGAGAVQLWSECHLPLEDKKKYRNKIFCTYENLWGYIISKSCWDDISNILYEYEENFLLQNKDYRLRPHNYIFKWLLFQHIKYYRKDNTYSYQEKFNDARVKYMTQFITGQDAVTIHSMYIKGWARIATVVNRGKYIGETGVHKNPQMFKKMGYDKIEMFDDTIHCD